MSSNVEPPQEEGAGAKSAVFRGQDVVAYGFMCGEKDDMEDVLREARRMVEKAGQLGDGWFAWKFVRVHEEFFNFGGEDPGKELGNQPKENGQQVQK
ncbi:hypothetical protein CSOJ01_01354 [Colletotrichum sojae]|uniref:Uncharacterized protein n=1 Tax=Colletotrichum sojae TaxID=2175907 RepID=A0A8H6JTW0_9PEZI|nr:hypothetical protein CSOJ01_01354 [Colletotrichum sojae]